LKLERLKGYAAVEGALALFGGWTGVDLKGFKPDAPLGTFESNQMRHLAAFFGDIDPDKDWTFADMCDYMKLTSVCPVIVGTPVQVADELELWLEQGQVDGFNLLPVDQPGTLRDFVDLVVPELQRRGRMRTQYPEGRPTLRQLYAQGGDGRIAADHPARHVTIAEPAPADLRKAAG
jgi:alkanesulfonate monooxygenase SsuD/methylene tetrahydromethanopterin reductase-like flavin-dependent oxidoreductase (luciferase family)